MKVLRVLLTTLALTCTQAGAIQLNKAAEALLGEAHLLLAQGRQQDAFNKYADAAKADPASSLPLSSMANMLADAAQKNEGEKAAAIRRQAEGLARQALALEPADPVAQEVLRQLADDKPLPLHQPSAEAEALLREGEILFNARKLDEALVKYERAAQVDPKYSTAWIYAGDCFFFQQKWAEAEARFRKGVEAEPLNAQGWRFLADALIHQNKRDAAEAALVNGIAAQPSQLPNWERLAQLRGASGYPLTHLQLAPKAGGQAGDRSFATALASWTKALSAAGDVTEPSLQTMQMLAKADQLEAALLLLQYKESYRDEFEAWKTEHPNGIRKFIDTYGLRP